MTARYKVCMLGAFAVGKTSLVRRYVHSIFSDKYLTTVGVKVEKRDVAVGGDLISAQVSTCATPMPFHVMRRSSRLLIAAVLLALLAAITQSAAGATESDSEATIEAAAGRGPVLPPDRLPHPEAHPGELLRGDPALTASDRSGISPNSRISAAGPEWTSA